MIELLTIPFLWLGEPSGSRALSARAHRRARVVYRIRKPAPPRSDVAPDGPRLVPTVRIIGVVPPYAARFQPSWELWNQRIGDLK